MAILSEILRFILPPTKAKTSEFLKLRQQLAKSDGVRDQYFGYTIPVQGAALAMRENEMCWVIQWPQSTTSAAHAVPTNHFRSQLKTLISDPTNPVTQTSSATSTPGAEDRSLIFSFSNAQVPELNKALAAPICEFAFIALPSTTPKSNPQFNHSMNKTFTDCYLAPGFEGGAWAYASNTNDAAGTVIGATSSDEKGKDDSSVAGMQEVPEEERRVACYYLGWESSQHHKLYTQTPLFAEEIDKLSPHFGPGTGAWYVNFEKH